MPRASRFLTATVPSVMATNLHRGLVYRGGALNLGVLLTWGLRTSGHTRQRLDDLDWVEAFRALPLNRAAAMVAQDVPHWRDWVSHEADDGLFAVLQLNGHRHLMLGNIRRTERQPVVIAICAHAVSD